jgi:hypothetical protein
MCKNISPNIKIIKLNYDNMTQQEYSNFLTTKYFWNLLNGEKILIYQEDSIIFKNNIKDFLHFDYIGAPFPKSSNDTPNCVGNGGLSLRTKIKMLEVIEKYSIYELNIESSTMRYMSMTNLLQPPEDVYFSKNMQENNIGDVADWETAFKFSSESVFNPDSFGGHQFWISNKDWKNHMKKAFNYNIYKPKSDIKNYLKYVNLPESFDNTQKISNAFDIDLFFFCKVNNLEYTNSNSALSHLKKIGLNGFFYHPKQVLNIFPEALFYKFLNNIFVFYKNNMFTIQNFANKYIYNSDFEFISDLVIKKKYDCLNDNYEIVLLVFIGNEEIGVDLIKKIISYKDIQRDFNVAFCINTKVIASKKIIDLIKSNFDFYSVYQCKECGTDITPTMLMYDKIIKNHKFKHILKFHTKSIKDMYIKLTEYLLSVSIKELYDNNSFDNSNCIGSPDCYKDLYNDKFNNKLKNDNISLIDINKKFVAGTIFYTTDTVMDSVLDFIKKNNYRAYLLNNLYENNSINQEFSPIHFLERLFGVIKI